MLQLDESQLSFINFYNYPKALIAGPGSGKTHTLNYLVKDLCEKDPAKIKVVVMFSREATNQFRKRFDNICSYNDNLFIDTVHGLAREILKLVGVAIPEQETRQINDSIRYFQDPRVGNIFENGYLIIDEAQDLSDDVAIFCDEFCKVFRSKLIIVGDPRQQVKSSATYFSFVLKKIKSIHPNNIMFLRYNYRSNKKIVELLNSFSRKFFPEFHQDQIAIRNEEFPIKVYSYKYYQYFQKSSCIERELTIPGQTFVIHPFFIDSDAMKQIYEKLMRNNNNVISLGKNSGKISIEGKDCLLTAEKSKGLERPKVVFHGLGFQYGASSLRNRKFFVGMSRAQNHLTLIFDQETSCEATNFLKEYFNLKIEEGCDSDTFFNTSMRVTDIIRFCDFPYSEKIISEKVGYIQEKLDLGNPEISDVLKLQDTGCFAEALLGTYFGKIPDSYQHFYSEPNLIMEKKRSVGWKKTGNTWNISRGEEYKGNNPRVPKIPNWLCSRNLNYLDYCKQIVAINKVADLGIWIEPLIDVKDIEYETLLRVGLSFSNSFGNILKWGEQIEKPFSDNQKFTLIGAPDFYTDRGIHVELKYSYNEEPRKDQILQCFLYTFLLEKDVYLTNIKTGTVTKIGYQENKNGYQDFFLKFRLTYTVNFLKTQNFERKENKYNPEPTDILLFCHHENDKTSIIPLYTSGKITTINMLIEADQMTSIKYIEDHKNIKIKPIFITSEEEEQTKSYLKSFGIRFNSDSSLERLINKIYCYFTLYQQED